MVYTLAQLPLFPLGFFPFQVLTLEVGGGPLSLSDQPKHLESPESFFLLLLVPVWKLEFELVKLVHNHHQKLQFQLVEFIL